MKRKSNKPYRIAKIDPLFEERIREVCRERIKNGIDKRISRETLSVRRFTKAMTRYEPLWDILKKAEFKEEDIND